MTENEFLLADRIAKIKSINELYDLENNAYISFSGGKDSTVLSHLIDEALPNNKIPRVFFNTGIEYKAIVKFAERERERDERIIIINPHINIKKMLEEKGYPFKSKEHSDHIACYQKGGMTLWVQKYLGTNTEGRIKAKQFQCPDKLRYQFTPEFKLKCSKHCCDELKKKTAKNYEKESGKKIVLTGMRAEEGGSRANINCTAFAEGKLKKFHPLLVITEEFEEWFIKTRNVKLFELYYPPYNFERTGCKGCPYNMNLQSYLDTLAILLPEERKQCEIIWKPVYDEYRRIGFRLNNQPTLFE